MPYFFNQNRQGYFEQRDQLLAENRLYYPTPGDPSTAIGRSANIHRFGSFAWFDLVDTIGADLVRLL